MYFVNEYFSDWELHGNYDVNAFGKKIIHTGSMIDVFVETLMSTDAKKKKHAFSTNNFKNDVLFYLLLGAC